MKQNWTHKIITTIFTMVLVFPMLVKGFHIFEHIDCHHHHHHNHSHFGYKLSSNTTIEFEKKYHNEHSDCVICDFQISNQTQHFGSDFVFKEFNVVLKQPFYNYITKYTLHTQFNSSRAPPILA